MNSDSPVRRLATALLLGLALLPVLSFALLGFFARPMRDDFLRIGIYTGLPFQEAFQLGLNEFSAGYSFLTVKILLDPLGYTVVQLFPALLVAVWLSATALANNAAMLPHWRQYAAEFDERLSTIIELRATGQREFVFAPFSFDLPNYLGFPSLHEDGYLHIRYNIDRITLEKS